MKVWAVLGTDYLCSSQIVANYCKIGLSNRKIAIKIANYCDTVIKNIRKHSNVSSTTLADLITEKCHIATMPYDITTTFG